MLLQQLLQQYDAIHDDHKLVPLPRRPNVTQVTPHWQQQQQQQQQQGRQQ
jgi:hypothetical protein